MGLKYYIVDTETTGLKAGYHEMTEISIIRCDDRVQLSRTIKSEYPERANDESLRITGRTIVDLLRGDDRESVVEDCNTFFDQDGLTPEHRCIIAHNAAFDKRFCHALWESVQEKFPVICWVDSIKLAKEWALKIGQKPENNKLGTLLKFANIKPVGGVHNAESDAQNTYLLWHKKLSNHVNAVNFVKRWEHKLNDS